MTRGKRIWVEDHLRDVKMKLS